MATVTTLVSVILTIIICVIGLLGNSILIFVVTLSRDFKEATHSWYILQIAIANTLFLITLPFEISEKLNETWIYSNALCKVKETVLFLNYYSSIIFLTILSVDRYISIRKGFFPGNNSKRWIVSYIISCSAWMVSLLLCVPIILYSGKWLSGSGCACGYVFPNPSRLTGKDFCVAHNFTEPEELADCITWAPQQGNSEMECPDNDTKLDVWDESLEHVYGSGEGDYFFSGIGVQLPDDDYEDILSLDCHYTNLGKPLLIFIVCNFVVMFVIPCLVIATSYTAIVVHLNKDQGFDQNLSRQRTTAENTSGTDSSTWRAARKRGRVTLVCSLYVMTFIIGWLPFHAVHLAKIVGITSHPLSNLCRNLSVGTSLLAYAHSAVNPMLYIFSTGTKKIKRTFGRGRRKLIQATTVFTKSVVRSTSSIERTETNDMTKTMPEKQRTQNADAQTSHDNAVPLPEVETTAL